MKLSFVFFILCFVSCLSSSRRLQTVTYPIPSGKKLLLIQTSSRIFSDFYSEEREVNLRILEDLEELGYSVVLGEGVWEEQTSLAEVSNHLELFQKQLVGISNTEKPRIEVWKNRAESIGATEIFLIRHNVSSLHKTRSIRMFWMDLTKKEMIRMDWNWNPEDPFPFRENLRTVFGEKQ
ncbi:hypothetical protein EHQ68_00450 [Leptospira congkakensis]|uniref:Uncharacterized protein n=1 Tax=Leptospira congkakensis TaxID=2484932 RepID=A0A4Z1A279_9LEPT|nr:hypothetical protein [Leptospira congkakensis]TGL87865.1 hypothetical protein EHQ69_17385 [Leptospira congkakensis]TGL92642.1 hypothetical protein EHQ68_00450 [Leptospira congkakensis]TGL96015.1 hypothetical protein EHQ70_13055 [Leptospira congkakensis]